MYNGHRLFSVFFFFFFFFFFKGSDYESVQLSNIKRFIFFSQTYCFHLSCFFQKQCALHCELVVIGEAFKVCYWWRPVFLWVFAKCMMPSIFKSVQILKVVWCIIALIIYWSGAQGTFLLMLKSVVRIGNRLRILWKESSKEYHLQNRSFKTIKPLLSKTRKVDASIVLFWSHMYTIFVSLKMWQV